MENQYQPVVTHKKSKQSYIYKGNNIFENLVTGQSGEVSDEIANKVFIMQPEVSQMVFDYPNVLQLIKILELKIK